MGLRPLNINEKRTAFMYGGLVCNELDIVNFMGNTDVLVSLLLLPWMLLKRCADY